MSRETYEGGRIVGEVRTVEGDGVGVVVGSDGSEGKCVNEGGLKLH